MSKRWKEHLNHLIQGTHDNPYLQNSFNKHGVNKFVFVVLEEITDVNNLNSKEVYWINELNSMKGYRGWNMRSGGAFGAYGPELRKKVSFGIRNSEKSALSRRNRRKTYTLLSPTGELITFCGLSKFCETYGLCRSNVWRLLKGKSSHVHGWKNCQSTPKNISEEIQVGPLQRKCPQCKLIVKYKNLRTKRNAELNDNLCRNCAMKNFRIKMMNKQYPETLYDM